MGRHLRDRAERVRVRRDRGWCLARCRLDRARAGGTRRRLGDGRRGSRASYYGRPHVVRNLRCHRLGMAAARPGNPYARRRAGGRGCLRASDLAGHVARHHSACHWPAATCWIPLVGAGRGARPLRHPPARLHGAAFAPEYGLSTSDAGSHDTLTGVPPETCDFLVPTCGTSLALELDRSIVTSEGKGS